MMKVSSAREEGVDSATANQAVSSSASHHTQASAYEGVTEVVMGEENLNRRSLHHGQVPAEAKEEKRKGKEMEAGRRDPCASMTKEN
jgi:hypothetical protein